MGHGFSLGKAVPVQSGNGHDAPGRTMVAEPRAVDGVNAWPQFDVGRSTPLIRRTPPPSGRRTCDPNR